jgi:polysaccharide export outer membrane protein
VSLQTYAQPDDLNALCNDVTPANRAMAKSVGYDVGALCSGLAAQPKTVPAAPQAAAIPSRKKLTEEVGGQIAPAGVIGTTVAPAAEALKPSGIEGRYTNRLVCGFGRQENDLHFAASVDHGF